MKKILFLIMPAFICLSLSAGCGGKPQNNNQLPSKNSDGIAPSEKLNCDLSQNIEFDAQYIRTNGYIDGENYPKALWITDAAELNEYYEENKEKYYLDSNENPASDNTIGFIDAISKYDDAFFENYDLILVVLEEPSGSIRHKVTDVILQPSSMNKLQYLVQPVIERNVPEAGTDDMAEWHIIIEISKEYGRTKSELQTPLIK